MAYLSMAMLRVILSYWPLVVPVIIPAEINEKVFHMRGERERGGERGRDGEGGRGLEMERWRERRIDGKREITSSVTCFPPERSVAGQCRCTLRQFHSWLAPGLKRRFLYLFYNGDTAWDTQPKHPDSATVTQSAHQALLIPAIYRVG